MEIDDNIQQQMSDDHYESASNDDGAGSDFSEKSEELSSSLDIGSGRVTLQISYHS